MAENNIDIILRLLGSEGVQRTIDRLKLGMTTLAKEGKKFNVSGKEMGNALGVVETRGKGAAKSIEMTGNSVQRFQKKMKGMVPKFQGWALSIMFFGMAIQRLFQGILRKAFSVFNEVMATTEDGVSNIQLLSASMQYLAFTVGNAINSALAPFIPMIMDIIMALAEWVEKNPRLVAGIIIFGAALGALLTTFGMLKLAFNGVFEAFTLFIGKIMGTQLGNAIAAMGFGELIAWLVIIIAAVILLKEIWETNFGGIQDFMKSWVGAITDGFGGIFEGLKQSIKGFSEFVRGILTGDSNMLLGGLMRLGTGIIQIILSIITTIIRLAGNLVIFMLNIGFDIAQSLDSLFTDLGISIVESITKPLKTIFKLINSALSAIGADWRLPNLDNFIEDWRKNNDEIKSDVDDWQRRNLGYDQFNAGMASAQELINKRAADLYSDIDWMTGPSNASDTITNMGQNDYFGGTSDDSYFGQQQSIAPEQVSVFNINQVDVKTDGSPESIVDALQQKVTDDIYLQIGGQ